MAMAAREDYCNRFAEWHLAKNDEAATTDDFKQFLMMGNNYVKGSNDVSDFCLPFHHTILGKNVKTKTNIRKRIGQNKKKVSVHFVLRGDDVSLSPHCQ